MFRPGHILEDPSGCIEPHIVPVAMRPLRFALTVATAVALAACGESPIEAPAFSLSVETPTTSGGSGPVSVPSTEPLGGLGGAYTMTAGGEKITALQLRPTGIVLPPGLPIRVRISGAITRSATPGLKEFCSLDRWAGACASVWADIVAETPIPPSGASFVGGAGRALVAWEGGDPTSPSEGSSLTLGGPSGGELWAGRSEWGCYYFDSQALQGPCFTFGGGYTVTVEVDDGGTPADSAISDGTGAGGGATADALLRASATLSGASVHLVATATDGATIQDPQWTFLPDEFTTVEGDTTAPATPVATTAAAYGTPPTGTRVRVAEGLQTPGLHWGVFVERALLSHPAAAPQAPPAAAPPVSVSECDLSADCTTSAPPTSGTYVVVATVEGQLLSASARAGTGPAASLVLACPTGAIPRGDPVNCVVSASPPGTTLAVTGWHFDPDDPGLPPVERAANKTAIDWPGDHFVASGTVTVAGIVNGSPSTTSTHLNVAPRGWSGDMIPVEPPETSDDGDMSEQPARSQDEDGIADLGHIHQGFSDPDLASLVFIGGGPNGTYAYFAEVPVTPTMIVHVNLSQLNATSALAQRHPVRAAAFDSNSTCVRSQLQMLIAPIELHEGTTLHEKSHAGRFSATFNDLAAPAFERVVLGPQSHARDVIDDISLPIFQQAAEVSREADTDFKAHFPCNVNLFPS